MIDHPTKDDLTATAPTASKPTNRPELVWDAMIPGHPADESNVRIARPKLGGRQSGPGLVVLRPESSDQTEGIGHTLFQVKHFLIGAPLATAAAPHERLNKIRALAVFSSDALSSVAYATEEIMKVLILAGMGALALTLPLSITIALLL